MKAETWVAIYAAVIGTSAFMLNLKAWWDSGPKLRVSLISDGIIIGGGPGVDETDLVIVTVINRGDAPTMVTNLCLFEMPSWWRRWRFRPIKSYVIPNPQLKGYPPNVPSDLEPAKKWTGALRQRPDVIPDMRTGSFYVGLYASHRDRPYLKRVPKKKDPLPAGTRKLD
jgi:hypothetical protein